MKIKTSVKSGKIALNHNKARPLVIKTRVKAGALLSNHNAARA